MFHEVYAEGEIPRDPQNAIALARFSGLIDRLLKTKRFVRLDSYDAVLAMRDGDVALTFDDIYESSFRNAFPVLREREIPYTVFISTGLLDTTGYITKTELDELKDDSLCTIGAHSVTHGLSRFAPKKTLWEAKESAELLSARLYAFPYGSVYAVSWCNRRALQASRLFSCAFSTLNCDLTDENKKLRFFLPRRGVNDEALRREIYVRAKG